jgi:hypothetical protein
MHTVLKYCYGDWGGRQDSSYAVVIRPTICHEFYLPYSQKVCSFEHDDELRINVFSSSSRLQCPGRASQQSNPIVVGMQWTGQLHAPCMIWLKF